MKTPFAIALTCLLLTSCDYTVPLATTPETDADPALVGRWQRIKSGGDTESLLILPLDNREQLVVYPAGSDDAMYARACLVHPAGRTMIQLKWVGTEQAAVPDDARVYQFAAYKVEGTNLTVRMLSTSAVDKDVATTAALIDAIQAVEDEEDLFSEPLVFGKISQTSED